MGNDRLNKVAESILPFSYRVPLLRALSARSPVALLYHGVPPKSDSAGIDKAIFEQHVVFLKRYCGFVKLDNIDERRKALAKVRVSLTFDDGMRNHATVVAPILRRHQIPAVFFVCSRPATAGRYLWFVYLDALERGFGWNGFTFRGEFIDMSPAERPASVKRLLEFLLSLVPHPTAMYQVIEEELPRLEEFVSERMIQDSYAGMTAEQVGELANDPLFAVGVHTADHPFLTKCNIHDMTQQIEQNKAWLDGLGERRCNSIAYPHGDYDDAVTQVVRDLGVGYGYAVAPKRNSDSCYEIPRVGIYARSLEVLGFKAYWGTSLRRLGMAVG